MKSIAWAVVLASFLFVDIAHIIVFKTNHYEGHDTVAALILISMGGFLITVCFGK